MTLIDHLAGPQILMRGQISDFLTKAGIVAKLTIEFDQGAGFKPLPFALRHLDRGHFAIAARLDEIAARMRLGSGVSLLLTAQVQGYQTATKTLNLTAKQFARKAATIQVAGVAVTSPRVAAAPILMSLALKPCPVMLAGQVLSGNQLNAPVAGAKVQISGPGTVQLTTDAKGRFRFDAPPLALSWPLKVSLGARTTTSLHVTDFTTPVNFIAINLPAL